VAVPDEVEAHVVSSVLKALRDGVAGVLPNIKVQEGGSLEPADIGVEEALAYFPLSIDPGPTRRGAWKGAFTFQVTCLSKTAEARADKDARRPWRLASIVRKILDKDVDVRDWALGGGSTTSLGTISIGKPEARYVSDRLTNERGEGVRSNVHQVVLTFRAFSAVS